MTAFPRGFSGPIGGPVLMASRKTLLNNEYYLSLRNICFLLQYSVFSEFKPLSR